MAARKQSAKQPKRKKARAADPEAPTGQETGAVVYNRDQRENSPPGDGTGVGTYQAATRCA